MKFSIYFIALLTLAALTFQCGIFEPEDSSGSLRITIVKKAAKSIQPKLMASLVSVQCIVKKGSETIYNDYLSRQGSGFHGEITGLKPANNYSVQLNGKNDRGQTISSGSQSPVEVNPGKDTYVEITMIKEPVYTLDITVSPTDAGNVTKSPPNAKYNDDENVVLTAVANSGYQFDHWEGGLTGSANPATITMTGDKSVTAYFKEVDEIVFTPNTPTGPSSGKVGQNLSFSTGGSSSNKSHNVEYRFDWGDGSISSWGSSTQSHIYTVVGNYSVKAQARCQTHTNIVSSWSSGLPITISGHTLTVTVSPSGSGSVSKNLNKSEYNHGETVRLTPVPNTGYKFDRWGGDLTGSSNPDNLTMNGNKSVTAYFIETGDLGVVVENWTGSPHPYAIVKRYTNNWNYIDEKTANVSGVAYWSNIPADCYNFEAYYNNEYWVYKEGFCVTAFQSNQLILSRNEPYTYDVTVRSTDFQVHVINKSPNDRTVRVKFIVDLDQSSPWVCSQTSSSKTIPGNGGTAVFTISCTPYSPDYYYKIEAVETLVRGSWQPTDSWSWIKY